MSLSRNSIVSLESSFSNHRLASVQNSKDLSAIKDCTTAQPMIRKVNDYIIYLDEVLGRNEFGAVVKA